MTVLKFFILPFLLLTIAVFFFFYQEEMGDMGSTILGTIVYIPYVLLLTVVNFGLVVFGRQYLFKTKPRYFAAFLTTFISITILLLNAGHFKVHYWTLSTTEFIIVNAIILFFNLVGLYTWTKPNKNKEMPTIE